MKKNFLGTIIYTLLYLSLAYLFLYFSFEFHDYANGFEIDNNWKRAGYYFLKAFCWVLSFITFVFTLAAMIVAYGFIKKPKKEGV